MRFPKARAEGATKHRKAERPERNRTMHEYYEKARKDAREAMGNLITPKFDDSLRLLGLSIKNIKFTKDDFAEFFNQTLPSVSPSAIQ